MRRELNGRERGVMLIEALIAILIFSIGILAVVGMQSVAIRNVTEAKQRSDAAFLVSELTAQMWTDTASISQYDYPGSGAVPPKLTIWMGNVERLLPGATTNRPRVTVTTAPPAVGATVQIDLFWQLPEEASAGLPPRRHTVVTTIFTS